MENTEYSRETAMRMISEMNQAGKWFQNHAPDVCLRGAKMIEQMLNHISYLESCIEKNGQVMDEISTGQ